MKPTESSPLAGANGFLPLSLDLFGFKVRSVTLVGGPFTNCPPGLFGVCLLEAESDSASGSAVHLPIEDFSVPIDTAQVNHALRATLSALIQEQQVYVGCAAGWGRTGLFLSLLAKVTGESDPVGYVRRHYTERAVETAQQETYVERFRVSGLRFWLYWKLVASSLWRTCLWVRRIFGLGRKPGQPQEKH
jgi:hypothetical protein